MRSTLFRFEVSRTFVVAMFTCWTKAAMCALLMRVSSVKIRNDVSILLNCVVISLKRRGHVVVNFLRRSSRV